MEVCVILEIQEGVTWEHWLAMAQACEGGGLTGLFSSDHYLSVIGYEDRGGFDAWATLAALAACTRRIRLGTLVSPVTFRHPSELAKVVASVDHLSGGRIELGLGAGWNESEHRAYGFPFPGIETRFELLAEQLEIITRQWTSQSLSFDGAHYQLKDCCALPKPIQVPRPPIIIGGSAKPQSLRLATRFADEYNCFPITWEECANRRKRLDHACEQAGRDPATLRLSLMTTCLVGENRGELLARTKAVMGLRRMAAGDAVDFLRHEQELLLIGTVADVVERLESIRDAGVERVYLHNPLHDDSEMVDLIGAEILPALADS